MNEREGERKIKKNVRKVKLKRRNGEGGRKEETRKKKARQTSSQVVLFTHIFFQRHLETATSYHS